MKVSRFLLITLISGLVSLLACNSKKDAATSTSEPATGSSVTTASAGGTEQHYKCPTAGCAGGGAAQGQCPICGAELVHNPAYHTQQMNQTSGETGTTPLEIGAPGSTNPVTPTPPAAQNAKGVYHFTCPNGCAGGAGSAGTCSNCGAELAHNQEYHN